MALTAYRDKDTAPTAYMSVWPSSTLVMMSTRRHPKKSAPAHESVLQLTLAQAVYPVYPRFGKPNCCIEAQGVLTDASAGLAAARAMEEAAAADLDRARTTAQEQELAGLREALAFEEALRQQVRC